MHMIFLLRCINMVYYVNGFLILYNLKFLEKKIPFGFGGLFPSVAGAFCLLKFYLKLRHP